ncbi:MAG: hypothetical protein MZU95_08605 [Desulfomicrobium escambiense]|nr:hypothetical protein [Desulfomicrobium escambiense]
MMGFKRQTYDFSILVNEAERMVMDELERRLADDCRIPWHLHLRGLRAGHGGPRPEHASSRIYRVSLLGTMYAQAADGTEYADRVRKAVETAVEKVRKNPSHD